jgi:hypothetical protein
MDRRDGGLIYWRGRRCRLAQTLLFHGWTCPRSARFKAVFAALADVGVDAKPVV